MKAIAARLFVLFVHLGGFGLLALGVLDSSFLVMPLGNDLLVIAMTARRHVLAPYYAAMATAGSVLGCLLLDAVSRKGGEAVFQHHLSGRQAKYVLRRVRQDAGWALGFAALMPPPFPFTLFIVAAAAISYPRSKLLSVIAITRFLRFAVEGILAVIFGRTLLHWFQTAAFETVVICLIAVSILASVFSVYGWVKLSRKKQPEPVSTRPQ